MRTKLIAITFSILMSLFLAPSASATGTEIPVPNPEPEDILEDELGQSSGDFAIGGGINGEISDQDQPSPSDTTPADSDIVVLKPISQPEDNTSPSTTSTSATSHNTAPAKVPASTTIPARPLASRPAVIINTANTQPAVETSETEAEIPAPILPTVPNDNVAPHTLAEAPHTGLVDEPASLNPLAIMLLALASVTIISAALFVSFVEKAANKRSSQSGNPVL